jgi:hypothetical protein
LKEIGINVFVILVERYSGRLKQFRRRDVNVVIAMVASFVLTGIPPIVCETVLDEVVTSIKKKIGVL